MYYPFPLLTLVQDRQRGATQRPLTERDLAAALAVARYAVARFDKDQRRMLRRQAMALVATTLVPVAGSLLLDWPLMLVALAAIVDVLALVAVDEIRAHRRPGEVRTAVHFATQVEIVLDLVPGLVSGSGPARIPGWRSNSAGYLQHAALLLAAPLLIGAAIAHQLLLQGGWLPVLASLALPVAARIHEAATQARGSANRREPQLANLPQAPTALLMVGLASVLAAVALPLLSLAGTDHWDGPAVLAIWIATSALMALTWLRRMERGRATLAGLLAMDQGLLRHRIQAASHSRNAGEAEYLEQAMDPGSLWPPVWIAIEGTP